jgi:hypothetical protein
LLGNQLLAAPFPENCIDVLHDQLPRPLHRGSRGPFALLSLSPFRTVTVVRSFLPAPLR